MFIVRLDFYKSSEKILKVQFKINNVIHIRYIFFKRVHKIQNGHGCLLLNHIRTLTINFKILGRYITKTAPHWVSILIKFSDV